MKPITALSHAQKILRSQKNLQNAGKDAKKGGIDIEKLLKKVEHEFTSRQGSQPYDWQMKVTEAMLVKLDSIVIAGTGSGKTMPFMMVLLADPEKKALIISPLKILQEDQVARFKKFNISAVAVNGDTWCDKLAKVGQNYFVFLFVLFTHLTLISRSLRMVDIGPSSPHPKCAFNMKLFVHTSSIPPSRKVLQWWSLTKRTVFHSGETTFVQNTQRLGSYGHSFLSTHHFSSLPLPSLPTR